MKRLLILSLLLASTAAAQVTIPDIRVEVATADPQNMSLFCAPDGSGDAFDEAQLFGGERADATLSLRLTADYVPVENFPFEDMWLESASGDLVFCNGGTVADVNTDAAGMTFWQNPLLAGGHLDPGAGDILRAIVNGSCFIDCAVHNLALNSADMNGDLVVNLSDVAEFAAAFFGGYSYRSDFKWDGMVNLSDVVYLAQAVGAQCP